MLLQSELHERNQQIILFNSKNKLESKRIKLASACRPIRSRHRRVKKKDENQFLLAITAFEASAVFSAEHRKLLTYGSFHSICSERGLFIHLKDNAFMGYDCTVPTSAALMHFCLLTSIQKTITSPKSQHIVCDKSLAYIHNTYETSL